ncbi:MAG: hypothetical protein LLF94_05705 [Chlamydiales bacterium]|nr:hypothetical protein [Chlamydiales bacterium]
MTGSLFGFSVSNVLASVFNQKINIISSNDCLTDSAYVCASITQEVAQEHLFPSVIEALENTNSWDNLVVFADKITYCVLPKSDLIKSACWGALLNAHYIAGTILGIGLGGYILYRSECDTPKELESNEIELEQIPQPPDHLAEPHQNHTSAPAA